MTEETNQGKTMNICSQCGEPREIKECRCPHCGGLNSKIDDILAKEAEEIENRSYKGRIKKIIQAEDRKLALLQQWQEIKASHSKESLFALFVMFIFVFYMSYVVM